MDANKDRAKMLKQKQQGLGSPAVKTAPEKPTTLKGKTENFFYHYKFQLIFFIILGVFAGIFIRDMLTRVDYDLNVIFVSKVYLEDEENRKLTEYFEKITKDVTGNDKVEVSVSSIFLSGDMESNSEMEMASQMKIVTELSAGTSYAFIFDEYNYEHIFLGQDILIPALGEDKIDLSNKEISGFLPTGEKYYLGIRVKEGLRLKKEKDIKKYDEAVRLQEEFLK